MRPAEGVRRHRSVRGILLLAAALIATLAVALLPAAAFAAVYDPLNIMSEETWRASNSMSEADIQAFLDAQPGVLKAYSCPEAGPSGTSPTVKRASRIIWEASQYYGITPKLVLATLEKEQSLLSIGYHVATPTHTYGTDYHLMYAMGAGVYAGSPDRHPGFGDQVWMGTRALSLTTGAYAWYPGKTKVVSMSNDHDVKITIVPANQPTWNFYTYTPYYPQKSVWTIFVRYFGDPLASPALRPVYRFYNVRTATHFYTASEAERWRVKSKFASTYRYEGVAYSVNTSNTANSVPLYRFFNTRTGTHFYTASEAEKADVIQRLGTIYRFEGPAYNVSMSQSSNEVSSTPVYRFFNFKKGTHFYTASEAEKASVMKSLAWTYRYEGPAFYLAP